MANRQAIYYGRVSTKKQEEEGVGIEMQETQVEKACLLRDLELVGKFRDLGVSGTKRERPGLESALRECERVKGVMVVYSLSRLARSTRHLLTSRTGCGTAGVTS